MPTTTRYWKKKLILAKIEATAGVDAVPTPAANAIEARNVQFTPLDASYVENNVEVPYFGGSEEVPVSQAAKLSFDIAIQGPGTAGLAVAYGPLLRGAGFAEKLLAAPATGTATAGGANTITLAAGASAVDNAYQGMYLTLTGGTGGGQAGFVLAYNGTTKAATMVSAWTTPPDATTTYSIGAQAVYNSVSSAFEALSIYTHIDGLQHKLLFSRGSVKAKLSPKSLGLLTFDFTGLYTTPTDLPLPGGAVYSGFKQPKPVGNKWTNGFSLHGFAGNMYNLDLDAGQKVVHRDDVVGIEDVLITGRQMGGACTIQAPLMAEKDYFTAAADAVKGPLQVTHGTAAGLRARFCAPSTQVKNPKNAESNGVTTLAQDLRPCPVNGNDELFIVFD